MGSFREGERDAPRAVAWPELVPGGGAVVLDDWEAGSRRLIAVDLRSRGVTDLGISGWGARYLHPGYLVYGGTDGKLMAVRFDASALRVTGTPVAVAPQVAIARNNSPAFAVAPGGTVVHAAGYLRGSRREPMRVVGARRRSPPAPVSVEADLYGRGLAVSADGRTIALTTWDQSIWLADLVRGTRARLPRSGLTDILSLDFSPDGSRLALAALREGTSQFGIFTPLVVPLATKTM